MSDDTSEVIRSCGECTACCYTHAVGEIHKYEFNNCPDCTSTGCKIYEKRPRACGSYFCAWAVNDIGTYDERPDKVGVVCNTLYTRLTEKDPPSILMMEAWPGALEAEPAQRLMEHILKNGTSVRTGTKHGKPRYQYHVLRGVMDEYGRMLEQKKLTVVWHDPKT